MKEKKNINGWTEVSYGDDKVGRFVKCSIESFKPKKDEQFECISHDLLNALNKYLSPNALSLVMYAITHYYQPDVKTKKTYSHFWSKKHIIDSTSLTIRKYESARKELIDKNILIIEADNSYTIDLNGIFSYLREEDEKNL